MQVAATCDTLQSQMDPRCIGNHRQPTKHANDNVTHIMMENDPTWRSQHDGGWLYTLCGCCCKALLPRWHLLVTAVALNAPCQDEFAAKMLLRLHSSRFLHPAVE
jgi:hypothetical protein